MKLSLALCALAIFAGTVQHATAVRQLSQTASPTAPVADILQQFLPHKDANGVWQPANLTGVDFNNLTLVDLPPPDVFIELAMTSPYPMPNIPMSMLVDNTVKQWAGGKPPATVQDWLLLVQSASNHITDNLPQFLVRLLPNITLPDGQKVSIGAEAGKVIATIANGTIELPLPETLEGGVGISKPTVNVDLIKGINTTLEVVKRLPSLFKEVAQNVATGIQDLEVPSITDFTNEDGNLDLQKLLKNALNIEVTTPNLPSAPDAAQVLTGVAKAIPVVANQIGLNTSAMRLPDPAKVEEAIKKASDNQIFVTDKLGRLDLLATMVQLSEKLPEARKVARAVETVARAPQNLPELEDVAAAAAGRVAKLAQRARGPRA